MPLPQLNKNPFSKPDIWQYWPQLGAWLEAGSNYWWLADPALNFVGMLGKTTSEENWQISASSLQVKGINSHYSNPIAGNLNYLPSKSKTGRRYPGGLRPNFIARDLKTFEWSYRYREELLARHSDSKIQINSTAFKKQPKIWQSEPPLDAWQIDWLNWCGNLLIFNLEKLSYCQALVRLLQLLGPNLNPAWGRLAYRNLAERVAADFNTQINLRFDIVSTIKQNSLTAARRAWWLVHAEMLIEILTGLKELNVTETKSFAKMARILATSEQLIIGLDLPWFNNYLDVDNRFSPVLTRTEASRKLLKLLQIVKLRYPQLIKKVPKLSVAQNQRPPIIDNLKQYVRVSRIAI